MQIGTLSPKYDVSLYLGMNEIYFSYFSFRYEIVGERKDYSIYIFSTFRHHDRGSFLQLYALDSPS